METQIKAFYKTPQGIKFVTIFGYATKGVPSLEINGVGKLSKNIKEKLIYLTRLRKIKIPLRRFVICVDVNELNETHTQYLKWLEFPLLLIYWNLAGVIPIKRLDNCLASGWLNLSGDIFQMNIPAEFVKNTRYKLISLNHNLNEGSNVVDSSQLLEHIPNLRFKLDSIDQIDNDSAVPTKSLMT